MVIKPRQLVVIGDSGVYGWGDPYGGGWCEHLRKEWMNLTCAPVVYSLGIRGDGLEEVAKRWEREWMCRGELRRNIPEGLLLSIGLNDSAHLGRPDGRPKLSAEAFHFGLIQLIRKIKSKTEIMVVGLNPVNEKAMPFAECLWYSNKACLIYEAQIEEACLEVDVPFLPIHKAFINENNWISLIAEDGIHLNANGHRWIYRRIREWAPLVKWSGLVNN